MVNDSAVSILGYLVRTGIWASNNSLMRFKRVVIDVDSLIGFLYKHCVSEHMRRQRSIISTNQLPDLYSATLVNYVEFARHVKQFFDYLAEHNIRPILVYEGKFMEAPLFGLTAAKFKWNAQRMAELLGAVKNYEKQNNGNTKRDQTNIIDQLSRPNLALNIFKSIVNIRRKAGADIQVYQAFYSSYPVLAKLARDFSCPVLTNNGDFIIMDVRAGFVLIEEFWFQQVELENLVTRDKHGQSNSSFDGAQAQRSPRSVIKSASSGRTKSAGGTVYAISKFHLNSLFLRQHPGLNARLAINLFPLSMVDFVTKYSASLKRLKVYDIEFKEKDFASSHKLGAKQIYESHHLAARRLEMAVRFLAGKTVELLGNFIRGEATRTNTSFDEDYLHLTNYYSVAFEFKNRLRFILKYLSDPYQLNYIEWCLVNRECSSDFLLALLCCSIGHLASVSYNRWLQFEDLDCKHSAYSLLNRSKSMLMSLFSSNKSHQSEHSISISKRPEQEETVTRYPTAALTLVDRDKSKLVEHAITTTHEDSQLNAIRDKLQLGILAKKRQANKQDCVKFINLAFKCSNLTQMPAKLELLVKKYLIKDEHHIRNELAIVRSLYRSSFLEASLGDNQFKANYSKIDHHFELAIESHYIFLNQILSKQKHKELLALTNLINKQDFENVCNQSDVDEPAVAKKSNASLHETKAAKSPRKKNSPKEGLSKSVKSTTSNGHNQVTSKQIRHLIELLNGSLEAYCELNAFFDYPLPRLNLHLHYNPILIYNLTLYSFNTNKLVLQ